MPFHFFMGFLLTLFTALELLRAKVPLELFRCVHTVSPMIKSQKNPMRAKRIGFHVPWFVLHGVRFPACEADFAVLAHNAFTYLHRGFA
jgi:hypothetical protein